MSLTGYGLFLFLSASGLQFQPIAEAGQPVSPMEVEVMWKNIKNVVQAAADVVVIVSKEVSYQATKASEATETVTSKLAEKSAILRAKYESELADRKAGIKKPEVVTESETPKDVVAVN